MSSISQVDTAAPDAAYISSSVDAANAAIRRVVNPSKQCFICWIESQSDQAVLVPFPSSATGAICAAHSTQMTTRSESLKSTPILSASEYACVFSLLRGHVDSRSIPAGYRFTPLIPEAMRATLILTRAGLAALVDRNGYGIACFAMTAKCAELARSYALSKGVQ